MYGGARLQGSHGDTLGGACSFLCLHTEGSNVIGVVAELVFFIRLFCLCRMELWVFSGLYFIFFFFGLVGFCCYFSSV